jgi:hypothetical protein
MLEGAVYVAEGDKAVRVPVHTGVTDGNMTEVEGLEPGRLVIIDALATKTKAGKAGGSTRGF